jgi:hypothetical protein
VVAAIAIVGCGRINFDPLTQDRADAGLDALPADGSSCAAIHLTMPAAPDGPYVIDPDGDGPIRSFRVWCADMATTPAEYLELPAQTAANFATYASGGGCTCPPSTRVWQRVRIDPATLVVETSDRRFSTFLGDTACIETLNCVHGRKLNWGMAGSCVTNGDRSGRGNLDLTGTELHVALPIDLAIGGFAANGFGTYPGDGKTVSTEGGGFCGWYGVRMLGAADNFSVGAPAPLQLVQD